jgi:hypothetical protein
MDYAEARARFEGSRGSLATASNLSLYPLSIL